MPDLPPNTASDCQRLAHSRLPRRLVAMLYDSLIIIALWFIVSLMWLPLNGGQAVLPGSPLHLPYQLSLLACTWLYLAWCWRHGGQTLGARSWRLRLERTDGGSPGWGQTVVRFAVACVGLAALGAGFWWSWIDSERLTWHDMASGTRLWELARG